MIPSYLTSDERLHHLVHVVVTVIDEGLVKCGSEELASAEMGILERSASMGRSANGAGGIDAIAFRLSAEVSQQRHSPTFGPVCDLQRLWQSLDSRGCAAPRTEREWAGRRDENQSLLLLPRLPAPLVSGSIRSLPDLVRLYSAPEDSRLAEPMAAIPFGVSEGTPNSGRSSRSPVYANRGCRRIRSALLGQIEV